MSFRAATLRRVARPATAGVFGMSDEIDLDVLQWRQAVITAGGSISGATLTAANRFVRETKANGIWAKLYMVDLCAGADLTSMLVRLKVPAGVSRSYTNVNFVAGDYAETGASGGLKGDGSSKYLNSVINLSTVAPSNSSFGMHVYVRETVASAGTSRVFMSSATDATTNATLFGWVAAGTAETGAIASQGSPAYATGSATQRTGLLSLVNNGDRLAQYYQNASAVGAAAGTAANSGFYNGNVYVHAQNLGGSAAAYQNRRISSKFISRGFSATELAAFYSSVLAFETALGRNV